jgi:hypothetical protein
MLDYQISLSLLPGMFHEYLLRDAVLVEVEDRRGAREKLGDTPPDSPLPLELLRRTTVDVEDSRNGELQLVKILTYQRPDCELTGSTGLNNLREGGRERERKREREVGEKERERGRRERERER